MSTESESKRRSGCPLNIALEMFGDRWTLLILRDLMFLKRSTFREFQESAEGIASNILSDRLKKLQAHGIITGEKSAEDGRIICYRPTTKGLDLLPVMVEMILWADQYEHTAAPPRIMKRLKTDRSGFIDEVRSQFP
ncbi:MAG: helix-turn-helix transcriptional regulator [Planctomycetaceae bacterium]|nr:helix-turn-helix transcriptional regulator [Planctomycetaceae bacterium]